MKSKILFLISAVILFSLPLSAQSNDTIKVSTARGFLQAIGSDRVILLDPGVYKLSEANEISLPSGVKWDGVFDGEELVVNGISNLTICSEGKDKAHIIVDPRYAYVLKFTNCEDISLENILAGHSEGGYCQGGVFAFEQSTRITLKGVNMYGSGTEGLLINKVSLMTITGSSIFECTYQIMTVSDSQNITFSDCLFYENREFSLINVTNTTDMLFDRCAFINNSGTMYNLPDNPITITNSYFSNNEDQGYGNPKVLMAQCLFEANVYRQATVTGDRVRVRAQPNTSAEIKRQINKGTVLYLLKSYWAMQDSYLWYMIYYEGEFGWITGEFIRFGSFKKEE